jgi:hypothetical protein
MCDLLMRFDTLPHHGEQRVGILNDPSTLSTRCTCGQ